MSIRRQHRRYDLAQRLQRTRTDGRATCWVFGCKTPPGNASGKGLGRFCRTHLEHYRRHGDPLKGSYKAHEVAPHRVAARAWLEANSAHIHVSAALGGIEALMLGAGRAVEPRNLRGVSTADKARSVWGRLRDKGRSATDVLTAVLGVAMCYAADFQRAKPEHRQVQIAKVLSRMGGGQVKRWPDHHSSQPGHMITLRWFQSSEGLVLRELGQQAERVAEFLIHDKMDELLRIGAARRHEAAMGSLPFLGEASDAEF